MHDVTKIRQKLRNSRDEEERRLNRLVDHWLSELAEPEVDPVWFILRKLAERQLAEDDLIPLEAMSHAQ
jgi:hypothetical protein